VQNLFATCGVGVSNIFILIITAFDFDMTACR